MPTNYIVEVVSTPVKKLTIKCDTKQNKVNTEFVVADEVKYDFEDAKEKDYKAGTGGCTYYWCTRAPEVRGQKIVYQREGKIDKTLFSYMEVGANTWKVVTYNGGPRHTEYRTFFEWVLDQDKKRKFFKK